MQRIAILAVFFFFLGQFADVVVSDEAEIDLDDVKVPSASRRNAYNEEVLGKSSAKRNVTFIHIENGRRRINYQSLLTFSQQLTVYIQGEYEADLIAATSSAENFASFRAEDEYPSIHQVVFWYHSARYVVCPCFCFHRRVLFCFLAFLAFFLCSPYLPIDTPQRPDKGRARSQLHQHLLSTFFGALSPNCRHGRHRWKPLADDL